MYRKQNRNKRTNIKKQNKSAENIYFRTISKNYIENIKIFNRSKISITTNKQTLYNI